MGVYPCTLYMHVLAADTHISPKSGVLSVQLVFLFAYVEAAEVTDVLSHAADEYLGPYIRFSLNQLELYHLQPKQTLERGKYTHMHTQSHRVCRLIILIIRVGLNNRVCECVTCFVRIARSRINRLSISQHT